MQSVVVNTNSNNTSLPVPPDVTDSTNDVQLCMSGPNNNSHNEKTNTDTNNSQSIINQTNLTNDSQKEQVIKLSVHKYVPLYL